MRWGGGGLAGHEKENVVTPMDRGVETRKRAPDNTGGSCGKQKPPNPWRKVFRNVAAGDRRRRGRDYREGEVEFTRRDHIDLDAQAETRPSPLSDGAHVRFATAKENGRRSEQMIRGNHQTPDEYVLDAIKADLIYPRPWTCANVSLLLNRWCTFKHGECGNVMGKDKKKRVKGRGPRTNARQCNNGK